DLPGDAHGFEHGNRASRENAEGAGEARRVEPPVQLACDRNPQLQAMPAPTVGRVAQPAPEKKNGDDQSDEQVDAPVAQETAGSDEHARGQGKLRFGRLENRYDL